MDPELQAHVSRAADPRLIAGIYNYCNRRCDRCRFTDRCMTFLDVHESQPRHPDRGVFDQVHESFQRTYELLQAWCAREGVDFDRLRDEATSDEARENMRRMEATVEADPLQTLATTYTYAAYKIVHALGGSAPSSVRSVALREAVDAVAALAGSVRAKVNRALYGVATRDDDIESDPRQSDWNGSAKVARIVIAESRAAWETIFVEGQAPADSAVRALVPLLDRLDAGLADRFPDAMAFVRPGFDEPERATEFSSSR